MRTSKFHKKSIKIIIKHKFLPRTNFITAELFNLRSPPLNEFEEEDNSFDHHSGSKGGSSSGYFGGEDKLHPTQQNRR